MYKKFSQLSITQLYDLLLWTFIILAEPNRFTDFRAAYQPDEKGRFYMFVALLRQLVRFVI